MAKVNTLASLSRVFYEGPWGAKHFNRIRAFQHAVQRLRAQGYLSWRREEGEEAVINPSIFKGVLSEDGNQLYFNSAKMRT